MAGRVEQADAAFEPGLGLYRQFGDENFAARALNRRAQCALARDGIERACSLARDALAAFEHSDRQGIAESLDTLAAVAAARSAADLAATIGAAASGIREANGLHPLPDLAITGRYLEAAERAADQGQWRPAWEAGRLLTTEAAVALGLQR